MGRRLPSHVLAFDRMEAVPLLSETRFLLTNDDGIDAAGLEALTHSVSTANAGRLTVAPADQRSGVGHATTTDQQFQVTRRGQNEIVVDAEPADCVRIALHDFRDRFDWVLAGINSGGNLGVDIYYSGTVAAAREAAIHGVPAIAISHYKNRSLTLEDWRRAGRWIQPILEDLLSRPVEAGVFWNINLPCPAPGPAEPRVVECHVDTSPLQLAYRSENGAYAYSGRYQQRGRSEGSDIDVCFGGGISITRLQLP